VHGAFRNKYPGTCDWFRNGALVSSGIGALPNAPTVSLWVGNQRGGGITYIAARLSYFYLVDKYLDNETIARLAANPYLIFQSTPRIYNFAAAGAGGPTVYTQSLGGVLTPAGSLAKLTARSLTGSSTSTGSVAKQTQIPVAGSSTFVGNSVKQTYKAVGGSSTATGALTRLIAKGVAGSLTGAGSLAKSTLRAFAGSITPSGDSATTIVFTQAVAGSMTLAGAISKMTLKAVTGESTLSGAVTKLTNKSLSASITVQGAINRLTTKAFIGVITAAGALFETYAVAKALAGSIKPTGTVAALYIAFVAGVLKLLTLMGIGQ
jgi:hypothetical protein